MRKTLLMLPLAAAAVFSTAVAAQPVHTRADARIVAPAAAAVGTGVGLAVSEGWFGTNGVAGYTTAGGAGAGVALGGAAAIWAIAGYHALTTPCQGAHALLSGLITSPEGCENGRWVGYGPRRAMRR